jgi:hypothetical protein
MSAPPTAERAERSRNVTIMASPALWPAWPYLPLVRRTKGELTADSARSAAGLLAP